MRCWPVRHARAKTPLPARLEARAFLSKASGTFGPAVALRLFADISAQAFLGISRPPLSPSAAAMAAEAPTLASLAADVRLDPSTSELLWAALELNPDEDLEVAAAIPDTVLANVIEDFRAINGLSAGAAGRISLVFSRARAAVNSPGAPSAEASHAAAEVQPISNLTKFKFSAVLDQGDDNTFVTLPTLRRAELRQRHLEMTGGKPPEGRAPNSEQLAALEARLKTGEAPYADFAVFTPHGRRQAKLHKFEAQVFVGNQLTTRMLRGPADLSSWKASWAVFRAAMIMLGEASPATLDVYEGGITQLMDF